MPYGNFTPTMIAALTPFVAGRVVHDLGAGDLTHTWMLLNAGAFHVFAVDRQAPPYGPSPHVTVLCCRFDQLPPDMPVDVAFVAWPDPRYVALHLEAVVARARVVVYLGCNFDGTACGNVSLFRHFAQRSLLAHEPTRANTLLILGAGGAVRALTPEESAGMDDTGRIHHWPESVKTC